MKSKLTLRLDKDLKERAKRLAKKRSTSVSKIVEHYFRLLQEDSPIEEGSRKGSSEISGDGSPPESPSPSGDSSSEDTSGTTSSERPLSPRVRRLKEKLGKPAPEVEMDEDTRRWVEATAEKHA